MSGYAVQVRHLSKQFKNFSLKDVSFELPRGYIMGFIGPNGRGKSTTISALTGRLPPDGGKALVFGKEVRDMTSAEKEDIGYVPDECPFPGPMTFRQVDRFMKMMYTRWDSDRFIRACEKAGLPRKGKIQSYSKGMKMRLSIAAATCHGRKLLIMDEATSGLDPVAREEVLEEVLSFAAEGGSALLSSHIISDLEKVCDYITFIKGGQIVFSREKDALSEKYGILRCTARQLRRLEGKGVVSRRVGSFNTSRLVERRLMPRELVVDKAGIEDIMIYFSKEDSER